MYKTAAPIFVQGGGFIMQGFSDILPRSDTERPLLPDLSRGRGQTSQ